MSTDKLDLGNKAFAQKHYEQALKFYLEALEARPDDTVLLTKAGMTYYKLRDFPNAIALYEKVLTTQGKDKDILYTFGLILIKAGEKTKALGIYDRLKKIHPDKAEALYKEIYA